MRQKRCDLPKWRKQVRAQAGVGFQLRPSCLHSIQQDMLNLMSQKSQVFPTVISSTRLLWVFLFLKSQYEWWLQTLSDIYSISLGKNSHFSHFFLFPYELPHNKVIVFHDQNYKPSPYFSGTTVLKRLFTVSRKSYSSAVLLPCWRTALQCLGLLAQQLSAVLNSPET